MIMRKIILSTAVLIFNLVVNAQSNTASNIIEGGKTLVELVRVLKAPAYQAAQQNITEKVDSCRLKNLSDLSFKNSTDTALYITLTKRNGSAYETNTLTMKILPKAREYLYELRAGIYKYTIEMDGEEEKRVLYREGEMKLSACENSFQEIKF